MYNFSALYTQFTSMTTVKSVIFLTLMGFSVFVSAEPEKFFANNNLQSRDSTAFALSQSNLPWLNESHKKRDEDAKRFVAALNRSAFLAKQLKNWSQLSFEERMKLLPAVFDIECQVLGMVCPELVINNTLYPTRPVNFVFDMKNPGSGLVYLNPDKLKSLEPYVPLAFLIHETRHAYQFQLAFNSQSTLAKGYKSAFDAQSRLSGFSFSDFLTLLNEYEAFQFGNHVIGLLYGWRVEMPMMGTFASQFDRHGHLKIDLITLANQQLESKSLLEKYNEKATLQYELRSKGKQ